MKRYVEGLRFGMLLQLAIGPMCLLVFHTAQNTGFFHALTLVAAIAFADGLYILLAGIGASKLLERGGVKRVIRTVGGSVLMLFGLNTVLNVWGINLIPAFSVAADAGNLFFKGLLLTLSNPLTILFWGSVLTAKIVEDDLQREELAVFSVGLVSATLFFMTGVAALGTVLKAFIPSGITMVMG